MRRKSRVKRSVVSRLTQRQWAVEACESRQLLTGVPVSLPNVTFDNPQHITAPIGLNGIGFIPSASSAPPAGVLTPQQVRGAYAIPSISFNGVAGDGTGQTIAIVDAYDDPNALADLQAFDAFYNLPNPPSFTKLNQDAQASPLPGTDPAGAGNFTWEMEESLDIEWAHAAAPNANIILCESNTARDLLTAVQNIRTVASVSVVSMSFLSNEFDGETSLDSIFTTPTGHQPITFMAAAGDSGAYSAGSNPPVITAVYPAASPNVIAVGGTTLTVNSDNSRASETAWGNGTLSSLQGGGGGGISQYEPQPSYQIGKVTQSTTNRTLPDISLLGDPRTGVAIYDSFDNGVSTPWDGPIGGTSLSTPLLAGVISIANQGRAIVGAPTLDGRNQTLPDLYNAPASDFHDIVNGNNGFDAGPGYDLASGLGSPIGNRLVNAFQTYIGDFVFNDGNANGIQDDGGGGLSGVAVTLKSPGIDGIVGTGDDTTVANTTTDSTGLFSFVNEPTGTYYVHFATAANFRISPQFAGTDPSLDSNADPTTGNTASFSYTAGTSETSIDCGQFTSSVSISSASAVEGNSGLTPIVFTVTLTGVNAGTTSVAYHTVDGTATTANNDYVAQSGTLTFANGANTATITIQVVGDTRIETNENFSVVLTNPSGFTAGNLTGVGEIINDDFPTVSVSSYSLLRPNSGSVNYPFTFTLSAAAPFEVDVPYTTQDVSAVGSIDYATISGTLIFAAGTTTPQTVNVPVFGSTTPTLDKVFRMVAEASPTLTITSASVGTGTILSNSPPSVSVTGSEVTESLTGLAYLPFTISVAPALTGDVTVSYATADGTAVAGTDYAAQSGTLTFSAGQLSKTVFVPVYRLFTTQQDKTVILNLSNLQAPGIVNFSNTSATGTIHDLAVVSLPGGPKNKVTYTDYLNDKVTVSLNGPGTTSVLFLGAQSTATDAYEVVLTGTTSSSSLLIKTTGRRQTSFRNIVDDSSLGSIVAKTTNLQGQIDIAGSLNSVQLNFISGSTIAAGSGSGSLAVNFGRALDTSITSAIPIRSITAGAYLNTDGVPDIIAAPSVGPVKVKGNFGATIQTQSLAALTVGGSLQNASVRATKSIGFVTAGSIDQSTLFAGVADAVTGAPTESSDFFNTMSKIAGVSVKNGEFSDSIIAGWSLGRLKLGTVQSTSGKHFGVVASHVTAVTGTGITAAATSLDELFSVKLV